MNIEDRVTRALAAEAEKIDVDVEALRARTRHRLATTRVPERAPVRPSRGPLLVAVAASVVLAAGAVVFLGTGGRLAPAPTPTRGMWT
jgi:negative regulator of sigma E activity